MVVIPPDVCLGVRIFDIVVEDANSGVVVVGRVDLRTARTLSHTQGHFIFRSKPKSKTLV